MPDPNDPNTYAASNDAPPGVALPSGLTAMTDPTMPHVTQPRPLRSSENVIKSAQVGSDAGALSAAAKTEAPASADHPDADMEKMIAAIKAQSDNLTSPIIADLAADFHRLELRLANMEAMLKHWHSIYQWPMPAPAAPLDEPTSSND